MPTISAEDRRSQGIRIAASFAWLSTQPLAAFSPQAQFGSGRIAQLLRQSLRNVGSRLCTLFQLGESDRPIHGVRRRIANNVDQIPYRISQLLQRNRVTTSTIRNFAQRLLQQTYRVSDAGEDI